MKTQFLMLAFVLLVSACSVGGKTNILPNPPQEAELVNQISGDTNPLVRPLSVEVDQAGDIYIVDGGSSGIHKYSRDGKFISMWGEPGDGQGQFNFGFDQVENGGVAVGLDGSIYVVDSWNDRIQKFDKRGEFEGLWGAEGIKEGQFRDPYSAAEDADGNVYVIDGLNNNVQKFDQNGKFILSWGKVGRGPGDLSWPNAMEIGDDGRLYVADRANSRVQVFDSEGEFLFKIGWPGDEDGYFRQPTAVAVDGNGYIYAADMERGDVQVFDREGVFIMKWGGGQGAGAPFSPRSIAVDNASGRVYIVDGLSDRVLVYQMK